MSPGVSGAHGDSAYGWRHLSFESDPTCHDDCCAVCLTYSRFARTLEPARIAIGIVAKSFSLLCSDTSLFSFREKIEVNSPGRRHRPLLSTPCLLSQKPARAPSRSLFVTHCFRVSLPKMRLVKESPVSPHSLPTLPLYTHTHTFSLSLSLSLSLLPSNPYHITTTLLTFRFFANPSLAFQR